MEYDIQELTALSCPHKLVEYHNSYCENDLVMTDNLKHGCSLAIMANIQLLIVLQFFLHFE